MSGGKGEEGGRDQRSDEEGLGLGFGIGIGIGDCGI